MEGSEDECGDSLGEEPSEDASEIVSEDLDGSEESELEWCVTCGDVVEICSGRHHLPTDRPLAEPPMLDYDDFIENKLPSDIRASRLFPNDIERWVKCRDTETERMLLVDYTDWTEDMERHEEDPARAPFYSGLLTEIEEDRAVVGSERDDAFMGVSMLANFEYLYLDQDGGTKDMRTWTAREWHRKSSSERYSPSIDI